MTLIDSISQTLSALKQEGRHSGEGLYVVSIATVLLSLHTVDGEADSGSSGHYTFLVVLACVSL